MSAAWFTPLLLAYIVLGVWLAVEAFIEHTRSDVREDGLAEYGVPFYDGPLPGEDA